MERSDAALRQLVDAIVAGDTGGVAQELAAMPSLARASFHTGATRQTAKEYYLDSIQRYILAGDTALHWAAAAYQAEIVRKLITAGAYVRAMNRHGQQPLHSACVGAPDSHHWNPDAQAATMVCLMEAGADPNAVDRRGVAPLHRAVRTRCAAAVRTLLEYGADPALKNKNGSTPRLLAVQNTGRGGTGSSAAKSQQMEILRLLDEYALASSRPAT
jgi:hypothetical protein